MDRVDVVVIGAGVVGLACASLLARKDRDMFIQQHIVEDTMEIVFLGTSAAVPTARRNTSGIAVIREREILLFDCGEGTQMQFQKAGLRPGKLTRIFISHLHGDHLYGLWSLVVSFTGHYGLLTMGVQSATTRYVAHAAGSGDSQATSRYINSALWMLLPAGVVTVLAGTALRVPRADLQHSCAYSADKDIGIQMRTAIAAVRIRLFFKLMDISLILRCRILL